MKLPALLASDVVAKHQRVRCAIGHLTHADVLAVTYQYRDMDGLPLAPFTVEAYDPPTCIVCGLKIWQREAGNAA